MLLFLNKGCRPCVYLQHVTWDLCLFFPRLCMIAFSDLIISSALEKSQLKPQTCNLVSHIWLKCCSAPLPHLNSHFLAKRPPFSTSLALENSTCYPDSLNGPSLVPCNTNDIPYCDSNARYWDCDIAFNTLKPHWWTLYGSLETGLHYTPLKSCCLKSFSYWHW